MTEIAEQNQGLAPPTPDGGVAPAVDGRRVLERGTDAGEQNWPDVVFASNAGRSSGGGAFAIVKWLVDALAFLVVLPLVVLYKLAALAAPGRVDVTYQGFSELAALWPGTIGVFLRRAFYVATLRRCSRRCSIGFGTTFSTPAVEIGDDVYVGARCDIGHATIDAYVLIGSGVTILSGKNQHHYDRLDVPVARQGGTYSRVRIGTDAWLGNGAIVMADVAPQAIVAAGAVVVKAVGPREIVAGNPARVVASRGAGVAAAER